MIPDVDHADILNPILREKGIRSLLGVPLLVEGRVIGVLHVGTLAFRDFTTEDKELLQLAADRAAPAIENSRLFEQRRVAEVLQRTLLPAELPSIAGLEVASRYVPAESSGLGGDWYDVFELPESRIAIAVGDVVGHGVVAAAVMAQLRTALRAYAAEGHDPPSVVQAVDRLMWQLGPTAMTTLAYLVLDPLEETIEIVERRPPSPADARRRTARPGTWTSRAPCRSAHRRPRSTAARSSRSRPARALCSSPTGWWSAVARRSTPGSTGSARSAPGATTSRRCARRRSRSSSPRSPRTTWRWSPRACRRWATTSARAGRRPPRRS